LTEQNEARLNSLSRAAPPECQNEPEHLQLDEMVRCVKTSRVRHARTSPETNNCPHFVMLEPRKAPRLHAQPMAVLDDIRSEGTGSLFDLTTLDATNPESHSLLGDDSQELHSAFPGYAAALGCDQHSRQSAGVTGRARMQAG